MNSWLTKESPRWLTEIVLVVIGICVFTAIFGPAIGAAGCALLFVCWLLVHGTSRMHPPTRRRVIVAYATLHLGTWAAMHALVSVPFHQQVQLMHQQASVAATLELARYRQWETHPDPAFEKHILGRVNPKPRSRVFSVSPAPFVLITNEDHQIGPLWGLGMTRIYTLRRLWTETAV